MPWFIEEPSLVLNQSRLNKPISTSDSGAGEVGTLLTAWVHLTPFSDVKISFSAGSHGYVVVSYTDCLTTKASYAAKCNLQSFDVSDQGWNMQGTFCSTRLSLLY